MKMQRINLNLYRGDDESYKIRILERFKNGDELPFDLSKIARIDLVAMDTNKNEVLRLSSEDGTISILEDSLIIDFWGEMTKQATFRRASYDLQLVFTNKRVKTVMFGEIFLTHDVTRLTNE